MKLRKLTKFVERLSSSKNKFVMLSKKISLTLKGIQISYEKLFHLPKKQTL